MDANSLPSGSEGGQAPAAELRRRLGATVGGEVLDVLSSVPTCLELFCSSLEPALESCSLRSGADHLRQFALSRSSPAMRFANHLDWLVDHGFSPEDTRQIRYVVESFYNLEPVFAIIAAAALSWCESEASDTRDVHQDRSCPADYAVAGGPIQLADGLSAPALMAERDLAPVHSFPRALAVWPEYAEKVWQDVAAAGGAHLTAVSAVEDAARKMGRGLAVPAEGRARALELSCGIQQCLAASSEVILIASGLRSAFVESESQARAKRLRDEGA